MIRKEYFQLFLLRWKQIAFGSSNKKFVVIENPLPPGEDGLPLKTSSLEESFEKLWIKMKEHYGVDLRKL